MTQLSSSLPFFQRLRKGYSPSQLQACSAVLRAFVSSPQFEPQIIAARDSRSLRISIVMPSYNQVRFIERSILSVLNQNYPNLQLIVMDGGSTDGTLDIIRKYEEYLIWRSEPDKGQSDALNKAIGIADGDLIGWQNSDDLYFPGTLQLVGKVARQNPDAVLYSGTTVTIDPNEEIQNVSKFLCPTVLRLLYEGVIMSSQAVFWRRDVLPGPAWYDPNLHHAMDMEFWIRILGRGHAKFIPRVLGGFRAYEGTKTTVSGARGCTEATAIRKQHGVDANAIHWALMRNMLRVSRLLKWTALTRSHCLPNELLGDHSE